MKVSLGSSKRIQMQKTVIECLCSDRQEGQFVAYKKKMSFQ